MIWELMILLVYIDLDYLNFNFENLMDVMLEIERVLELEGKFLLEVFVMIFVLILMDDFCDFEIDVDLIDED